MTEESNFNSPTQREPSRTLEFNSITGNDSEDVRGYEEAVDYPPEDDPKPGADLVLGMPDDLEEKTARLDDIGNSSRSRFEHTGDMDSLSEAIRSLHLLTPDGHPELPRNNLGSSFWRRSEHSEDVAGIMEIQHHLAHAIRSDPHFKDFLRPRKCADITNGLPEEGPVVTVNMHEDRCDALVLRAGAPNPTHIPLKFSFQEAERLANGLRSNLQSVGGGPRLGGPLDAGDLPQPVDLPTVLKALWSDVVSPILEGLAFSIPDSGSKLPRIWWCPTGPLAFLPIHAAGVYHQGKGIPGSCLSEFAVSSYIPAIHVLKACNSSRSSPGAPTGLLMINHCPKSSEQDEVLFGRGEIEKIESQLGMRGIPYSILTDESATVSRVLKSMEDFSSIHVVCHVSPDTESSLKRSIQLHDGPLEITEITKKTLHNTDFAFLSGGQTSEGDAKLPDEAIHLAAGMLTAGYRSVVGTMWAVVDEHGPGLAESFYKTMLEDPENKGGPKIDGRRAARALHDATKRLQEKFSDSPSSFLAWVPYVHVGI